jgi:ABC-type lipoprotein release transport system permease subunit
MLKLFFWLRYLRTRRMILLSIAAVAVSVSLLIVVASLFSGVINAYQRTGREVLGDIVLRTPDGMAIDRYPEFLDQLRQSPQIEAATATLSQEGLLFVRAGDVRPVSIWGIDPVSRSRVMDFRKSLVLQKNSPGELSWKVPGTSSQDGGYVGIGLLADPNSRTDEYDMNDVLKKSIGQRVVVTTAAASRSSDSENLPEKKRIVFYVADLVYTGYYESDSGFIFVPIERLQEAMYPDANTPRATRIHIKVKPGVEPKSAIAAIRSLWIPFATDKLGWSRYLAGETPIETAQQVQALYITELNKQMGVLLLIFGLVSFSVVVLVFCIFYMIVRLKQRDIAIMKSCGTASLSVIWLFLGFGVTIGIAGASVGAVMGYIITKNINVIENWISVVFGLKLWSGSVYMFTRIPNEVDWAKSLPIIGMAIAAAALGSLLPAFIAARTRPVEVLRYE